MLSLLSSCPGCGGRVGGADDECWNVGWEADGVLALLPLPPPEGILRMKFIGALGLASARLKRPAVAEGGKGCWG